MMEMKMYSEAEEWVIDHYYRCPELCDYLYDIDIATKDLKELRLVYDDIPKSLTPKILMETWNNLALHYANVHTPTMKDYELIPRHTQMTRKQIAEFIKYADYIDEVIDLVGYVINNEEDDSNKWTREIDEWNDQILDEVNRWCDRVLAEAK